MRLHDGCTFSDLTLETGLNARSETFADVIALGVFRKEAAARRGEDGGWLKIRDQYHIFIGRTPNTRKRLVLDPAERSSLEQRYMKLALVLGGIA
jgi:hypothetical protein